MPRSQIEILVEAIANLHIQLSAALARESELRESNESLANQLMHLNSHKLSSLSGGVEFNPAAIKESAIAIPTDY